MKKVCILLAVMLAVVFSQSFALAESIDCDEDQWVVCSEWSIVDCDGASETTETCTLCSQWICYTPSFD